MFNQEIIIARLGKTLFPMLKLDVGIFANAVIDHFGSFFTLCNNLLSLKKESLLDHGHP